MQPHGKFDTGVDAGRNHAALKIAEPARLRARPTRGARPGRSGPPGLRRAPGPAAAGAGPVEDHLRLQHRSESPISDVSGSRSPSDISGNLASTAVQDRQTMRAGYTLSTSVEVRYRNLISRTSTVSRPKVSIYIRPASGNRRAASLGTLLTNPATLSTTTVINTFRARGQCDPRKGHHDVLRGVRQAWVQFQASS